MSTKKSMSEQAVTLIIARGISFAITLVIPLMLVRLLSKAEFGAYRQGVLLFLTAYLLMPWGMSQSLYYFIPKDVKNRAGYLANTFLFLLAAGLITFVGFALSGPILDYCFHSDELTESAPWLGLYTFLMIASIYSDVVLTADNRVREAAWVILASEIVKAVAMVASALITRSYQGIVVGMIISAAARFIFTSYYFREELRRVLQGLDGALFRAQWAYSMPFGLMVVVSLFQDYFHQYYIAYSFSPAEFAIYTIGCLELPLIDLFLSSIGNIVMIKMTEQMGQQDRAGAKATWHDGVIKLALIFVPMTVYLIVVSEAFIVGVFTEKYRASVPIFIVSLFTLPVGMLLTDCVLRVYGETRYMLTMSIVRLPLTLIFVVGSLALLGMIGAAVGTVLVVVIVRVAMMVRIRSLLGSDLKTLLPWAALARIVAAALLASLPAIALTGLAISPKLILLISAPVYGLCYLVAGLRMEIFPQEDRELFKRYVLRFYHRGTESTELAQS